jgi:pilus assembly protein CpaC
MKRHLILTALLFCSFLRGALSIEGDVGEEIKLVVGEVYIFSVHSPRRVVITHPNVLDVTSVKDREIMVVGKAKGTTVFMFWDKFGQHSYKVKVFSKNIGEVKERIDKLLKEISVKDVYTKLAEDEEKVILKGWVKSVEQKERIDTILGTLKADTIDLIKVREEEVVDIEVKVLEVDRDSTSTLGLSVPSSVTVTETGPHITTTSGTAPSSSLGKWGSVFRTWQFYRTNFEWTLSFLVREGKARVLSQPHLACQSGKEAELLVGGEVPIFTSEFTGVSGSAVSGDVEYKEFGIKLNIRPKVRDKRIELALKVEVNDLGSQDFIGSEDSPTAKAYSIAKRNVSTELFLDEGETLIIGGMIRQKTDDELRKFPWLGDIPILGMFFRQRNVETGGGFGQRGDTELFITLTPKVISRPQSQEAKELALKESKKVKKGISKIPSIESIYGLSSEGVEYIKKIQKKIRDAVEYPAIIEGTGWQAELKVGLRLLSDGTLKEVKLVKSSGYTVFDKQIIKTVKELSYPPFPYGVKLQDMWIEVSLVYKEK